ncbi:MAG: RnfABCDGE type electron transport complex subunit D [Spirochaetia bacterium]
MSDHFSASGPHIGTNETVSKSMLDVIWALTPAFIASVVFFGPYSLYLVLATALFSTLFDAILVPSKFSLKSPFGDFSGLAAGFVLGLTLAPGSPWWIPILGAFLLVIVGKHGFGGLGNNIFNPALVARGLLLIGWPAMITEWQTPLAFWQTGAVDVFTGPTPLVSGGWEYLNLFLGNIPGSIGETSTLALLLGGVYLYMRGHRIQRIALGVIIGTALTAAAFGTDPLAAVLSGGLIYTALYMATDFVTSPMGKTPHWVFGVGIGVLTVFIREYGIFPEGVTFAVLLMNGCVYIIDKVASDPKFGEVRRRTLRRSSVVSFVLGAVLFTAIVTGGVMAWQNMDGTGMSAQVRGDMRTFFSDAAYTQPIDTSDENVRAYTVYSDEDEETGFLVYSESNGYGGPIRIVTALDEDREIDGLRVYDENESSTLGTLVTRSYFLRQFLGLSPDTRSEARGELAHISGATISSRGVASAVENALGFDDEPDEESAGAFEDLEDGTYSGTGSGYAGDIDLEVTVESGEVTGIEVTDHSETRQIFDSAWETLRDSIISEQTTEVDTVSGATGSSTGILQAMEDALED